eukprot:SAG31_NODE_9191_length_1319_cov_1.326230_2_plen_86_part_00
MCREVTIRVQRDDARITLRDRSHLVYASWATATHNDAGVVPKPVAMTWLESTDIEAILAIIRICHHHVVIKCGVVVIAAEGAAIL